jgi:hypothetical protein
MVIWYILWPFGIFYGRLVHFMAFWYILWPFGTFYGDLVYLWPFEIFMAIGYNLWLFGMLFSAMLYLNKKYLATLGSSSRFALGLFCTVTRSHLYLGRMTNWTSKRFQ